MSELVRMVVVLSPGDLRAWELAMLERLDALPGVELYAVETVADEEEVPAAYRLYERLENRLFGMFDDPLAVVAPPRWLVDRIEAAPLPDTDLALVLSAVRRQRMVVGGWAGAGVLWYDTADDAGVSLHPAGYHEVMARCRTSTVVVRHLGADGVERIVYRSRSSTDAISPRRNREQMFWKAQTFVPRLVAAAVAAGKEEGIRFVPAAGASPAEGVAPMLPPQGLQPAVAGAVLASAVACGSDVVALPRGYPDPLQLLRDVTCKLPDIFRFYYHAKLTAEQWYLLFSFSTTVETDLSAYRAIVPPRDRIWADPHVFVHGGRYYVFIEEMLFSENKGFISVLQIDEDGRYSQPVKVLERDYHLSYPQVFAWDGEIYMLPESSANRTIELYRCVEFPHRWELARVLIEDIEAVDASLLFDQGRWWLFCAVKQHPAASENDELHIFYSDDLLDGHWQPHAANPVISDVTVARPAGRIYRQGMRWIRPSQNCAGIYGFGFNLNAIVELDETRYREERLACVTADRHPPMIATHTWAREGRLTVVDACRRISRLPRG